MPEDGFLKNLLGGVYRGALRSTGMTAPADIQSLIGLGRGISQTGKLPRVEDDSYIFDTPAGGMPETNGQAVFLPRDSSPESIIHEKRHATQAATVPLAPAIGTIGSLTGGAKDLYTNPLEVDAYLSQPDSPETRNDIKTIESLTNDSPLRRGFLDYWK